MSENTYRSLLIYYFSGTGNSYRVARIAGETFADKDREAKVASIAGAKPREEVKDGVAHLLGLVFPTHAFTVPWAMLRFLLKFPRRRGTHAFVMPTRGGTRFGRFFPPGLEGTAGYLAALVLSFKGYRVRGVMGIDMPSNWVVVHPGYSEANARAIIDRAREKTVRFMNSLLAGNRVFRGRVCLLMGLLLLPVSLGFLVLGRFFLVKIFYASFRCTACGFCVKNCSYRGVRLRGVKNKRPYWTFSCQSCMRCMAYCPSKAVEASYLLAAVFCLVFTIPAGHYLISLITVNLPVSGPVLTAWLDPILTYTYRIGSIYIVYRLFHALLGLAPVNRLITHITPTPFFRRYHEPETKAGELRRFELQGDRLPGRT
ncbi:MAG: EFR1 family ferrodoxin [Peptococcaceae bacterium]|nr:EFR1 family ferrodoxin [Peptococcaceae bacterium]MDH7525953.1 EFR1 family ferrodoxin [Peptococcaceae bacterium]